MRTVAPTADTFLPRDPQEGPHAPVAARRAVEFVAATDDTTLTLLNVQPPAEGPDAEATATERGEEAIAELVERAGIEHLTYQTGMVVTEATRQAIVDAAGTLTRYASAQPVRTRSRRPSSGRSRRRSAKRWSAPS